MVKVGSMKAKAGSYWISKKAKQEIFYISDDLTVCSFLPKFIIYLFLDFCFFIILYLNCE